MNITTGPCLWKWHRARVVYVKNVITTDRMTERRTS